MIEFKFDVYKEMKNLGYTPTKIKSEHIFSMSTLQKIKEKNPNISVKSLNSLCSILNLQPGDILNYTSDK